MTESQKEPNVPVIEPTVNIEIDRLFLEALATVKTYDLASISLLQRRLKTSYRNALALIRRMEETGHVSVRNEDGVRTIHKGSVFHSRPDGAQA